ncbi:flagellar hook-length control protein FliK [uncultured Tateyamaria sp.]|uniref:flagellar hook-length control protein FliK n=1 Tax=uncultured Tateyamaria sp. TaxID=455651 RepID=UPI0026275F7C|nr:flagellar hook-length control protein FliK [uncultured Tateyamaria sp.]
MQISGKEPVTMAGPMCAKRGRIPEKCVQLIQTISTSPKTDPAAPTQPTLEHMAGTSFALAMGEDANETTEPTIPDMIAQAADEAALQAEKPGLDALHSSDFSSEGDGPPVNQDTEAQDTHKTSTTLHGEPGQTLHAGTTHGNSAQHTRNTSGEEPHARSNQPKKASPISAMIQGLSQPNLASDAAAVDNPKDAESEAHNKSGRTQSVVPATVAGMIGTEQQTKQNAISPESTSTNTSMSINRIYGLEPLKSHKKSLHTEFSRVPKFDGASDRIKSAEKVNFTAQAVASSQTGASSLVAATRSTQMQAPHGLPEKSNEPITATVRFSDQHTATSHTSGTGAYGSPLVPQGVATGTQRTQAVNTIVQNLSEQSAIGIEPTDKADELPWETRPMNAPNTAKTTPPALRAELPQHLSNTIAEAFKRAPDKPIEIALNPAELGRVRMIMSTSETGITVTVAADRGETLDLMRRNIDDLGKSLNDLGFEDVSFAFDQGQQSAEQQEQTGSDDSATTDEPLAAHQTTTPLARVSNAVTTGIDMRL